MHTTLPPPPHTRTPEAVCQVLCHVGQVRVQQLVTVTWGQARQAAGQEAGRPGRVARKGGQGGGWVGGKRRSHGFFGRTSAYIHTWAHGPRHLLQHTSVGYPTHGDLHATVRYSTALLRTALQRAAPHLLQHTPPRSGPAPKASGPCASPEQPAGGGAGGRQGAEAGVQQVMYKRGAGAAGGGGQPVRG